MRAPCLTRELYAKPRRQITTYSGSNIFGLRRIPQLFDEPVLEGFGDGFGLGVNL
jgi:hypothetical protein